MRDVSEVVESLSRDTAGQVAVWRMAPWEFVSDVFRAEVDDWQRDFMEAIVLSLRGELYDGGDFNKRRFAIRSGTGVGKTFCVSMLILWHLCVFSESKVVATAPTSPQLKAVLWPELRKWVRRIPEELRDAFPYEVLVDTATFYHNKAYARTAQKENPEAFQGFHEGNILLIADEASGVPDEIFNAGDGIMAEKGALTILIGNPTRASGFFYDAFHRDAHMYWCKRVSCLDSVRVTPEYAEDKARRFGENSYEYCVRVLGDFYLMDERIIIPLPSLERCLARSEDLTEPDTDYIVWGFDPSDGGRDDGAVSKRQGNVLLEKPVAFKGVTSDRQVDAVCDMFLNCSTGSRPHEIVVDAIGVGTNVFRTLKREIGEYVKITPVYVGVPPTDPRYASLRVELWGRARDWVRNGFSVINEYDAELFRELSAVEWEIAEATGKYRIPDKSVDGRSPNKADSFLLTFFSNKANRSSLLTKFTNSGTIKAVTSLSGSASWLRR